MFVARPVPLITSFSPDDGSRIDTEENLRMADHADPGHRRQAAIAPVGHQAGFFLDAHCHQGTGIAVTAGNLVKVAHRTVAGGSNLIAFPTGRIPEKNLSFIQSCYQ